MASDKKNFKEFLKIIYEIMGLHNFTYKKDLKYSVWIKTEKMTTEY